MTGDVDLRDDGRTMELLARGGFELPDAPVAPDVRPAGFPRYDALRDPAGAEQLGRALARSLEADDLGTVLIWQETDVALGFVVARELGVPAVRCVDNDGLVAYDGAFGAPPAVVIVGDVLRDAESIRAMLALAEQQGKTVEEAAVLLSAPTSGAEELRLREVPVRSLATIAEQR